jgi:predicted permease
VWDGVERCPTNRWWVLPIAVVSNFTKNDSMNKFEKLTIGLIVLVTAIGIGGWILWNYMLNSMV